MKWFKHFSMAHADDKIVTIRTNFGMWGVGCYWTILEMVAQQMKHNDPEPTATFNLMELSSFLGCKRNKLETFLECLQNVLEMKLTRNGNILTITIPKLLKIKDNYIKDFEVSSKQLQSIEVEEEVEEEVDKKKRESYKRPDLLEIEKLFDERQYPRQEAGAFFNYYQSNGWRVGRNPMKDWKAAAANWMRNAKEWSKGKPRADPNIRTHKRCGTEYDTRQFSVCPVCFPKHSRKEEVNPTIAKLADGMKA